MRKIGMFLICLVTGAALARAPGEISAWHVPDCDHACLTQHARDYMSALGKRDAAMLKQREPVRFTENNVSLHFGKDGLWATVTGVASDGLIAADAETGNVAWLGTVAENGKPVYFAVRLKVQGGAIAEAETVVVRNTGLPLPFGDVSQVTHDPAFNEILPPGQRRPRERLRAVADGYFNTVELNDGNVFTVFDPECARLENGILTTAAGASGSAGALSPGCEAQFKLGIYRINKRIRERRYPIIDVERGVVVATGFFDHANEFDRYLLTDGREMRTALKWPNSITLIEAFRVRDSKIQRIEAVFSYVPHLMHNPFFDYPPAPAPAREAAATRCDAVCLRNAGDKFMTALAARNPQDVSWANGVKFTENGVGIQVGEGIWGSIRGKSDLALRVIDPDAASYVWYGLIFDHDAPAYAGVRLRLVGDKVSEAEVVVARERNPGPWGDPRRFAIDARFDATVTAKRRATRDELVAVVQAYADTVERNDGTLKARFAPDCTRTENGVVVSQGDIGSVGLVKSPGQFATGCEAQLQLGLYRPLDRLRGRRVLAVDEERGLVVLASLADFSMAQRHYLLTDGREVESDRPHPMTRELFEIYKAEAGRIRVIEAVSVDQPYGMPGAWDE